MIRIALIGEIGSGKSYVARSFRYPVFDADKEVSNIYKKDFKCFKILNKKFPNHILSFPIKKVELGDVILKSNKNLKKISKIVHPLVRNRLNLFLKKNSKSKIIVLDIPLLLEKKLNKKKDFIIYVQPLKKILIRNLRKRKNYNSNIYKSLKQLQLPVEFKKKKANFVLKNDFSPKTIKKYVKMIKKKLIT